MNLLLDTQVWLWSLLAPERLNREAQTLLAQVQNQLYLSSASVWEISIKAGLGKLPLPEPPASYVTSRMESQGILTLNITRAHALEVFNLPAHHRDPFDRMLIAQSRVEKFPVLTADPLFKVYEVEIIWSAA